MSNQEDVFQNRIILFLSVITALWVTVVYYPGIYYSDSFARWDLAFKVFHNQEGYNKYTIVPSLWMGFTYLLTHQFASYSLLQSFLFFYSSLHLIKIMGCFQGKWFLPPTLAFITFPLFQGYSVFLEPSIGTVIGINFLLILLFSEKERTDKAALGIFFIGYFLVFTTIFGFRQNTITILPVVLLLLTRKKQPREVLRMQWIALFIALLFVYSLPDILARFRNIKKQDEINIAFVWETAQIIKMSQNEKYDHYLDYLGKDKGATKRATINIEEDIWMGMLKKNALQFLDITRKERSQRILKDYLQISFENPKLFFENKIYNASRMLGMGKPLKFYEFGDGFQKMRLYGCQFTKLRHQQIEAVKVFMKQCAFLSKPYIIFLIGEFFVIIGEWYLDNKIRYLGTAFALAVFYYLAFLLITERFEFRYFFPSFYLLWMICTVVFTKLVEIQVSNSHYIFKKEP